MNSSSLMNEGLTLMVFGMGFVFVFLALLVVLTNLMSRLVTKYAPDAIPAAARVRTPPPAAQPAANQDQLLAVISAAIHQYRSRHKR